MSLCISYTYVHLHLHMVVFPYDYIRTRPPDSYNTRNVRSLLLINIDINLFTNTRLPLTLAYEARRTYFASKQSREGVSRHISTYLQTIIIYTIVTLCEYFKF